MHIINFNKIYESSFNTRCSALPLSPLHVWAPIKCFGFGCRLQQERHAAAPPPAGVRRRMKRNRQKLVGRDKGTLTEQQTEGNRNNNDTDKKKTQQRTARPRQPLSWTGPALCPPLPKKQMSSLLHRSPPLFGKQRDVTWYGIPGSVWPGGVSPHPPAVPLPGFR